MPHPDNTVWNTINRIALQARPKLVHWVSLGDWMDEKYRAELTAWADQAGYVIGINADDLGPMNDHVRLGGVGHDERQEHEERSQDYSEAGGMK